MFFCCFAFPSFQRSILVNIFFWIWEDFSKHCSIVCYVSNSTSNWFKWLSSILFIICVLISPDMLSNFKFTYYLDAPWTKIRNGQIWPEPNFLFCCCGKLLQKRLFSPWLVLTNIYISTTKDDFCFFFLLLCWERTSQKELLTGHISFILPLSFLYLNNKVKEDY